MFFVISGELNLDKTIGMVAGQCAVCGQLALFQVRNIVRQHHAYFIPIGSRKLLYTELICQECGGRSSCDKGAFADVLPEEEAKSLHFGEVLRLTNPDFAKSISHRARLEENVKNGDKPRDGRDPRVELAFAKIAELPRADPRVIESQALLAQWSALDEASRGQLLRRIDALSAEQKQHMACLHFTRIMADRFKPEIEGYLMLIIFFLPILPLIALSMMFLERSQTNVAIGFGYSFLASIGIGMVITRLLQRRAHRRFFRDEILPEAKHRNVDMVTVVDMLGRIDVSDQRVNERMRDLVKSLPLLKEVLAENDLRMELAQN